MPSRGLDKDIWRPEKTKKPSSMPIFEDIRGRTTGVCVRESERIVNETGGKSKMCFHQDNCL